jgi:hypothetical protein
MKSQAENSPEKLVISITWKRLIARRFYRVFGITTFMVCLNEVVGGEFPGKASNFHHLEKADGQKILQGVWTHYLHGILPSACPFFILTAHNYSLLAIGTAICCLDGNFMFIRSGCILAVTVQHTNIYHSIVNKNTCTLSLVKIY